jgi:NarL family two-component system response regulator LiaR
MPDPIRVCIVDDHAVVRRGLRAFLAGLPDMDVMGEAATGAEAVALVRAHRPDVVLIDLLMPGMDGFDAIRQLREQSPGSRIVVLTSFSADGQVLRALRAGALSYVLKDADAEEIAVAVRKAVRGEPVIAAAVAARMLGDLTRRPSEQTEGLGQLTNRELEVLRLIADGLSNAIIADRLGISEGTVKTHVNNVLGKLQLSDRTQAAVLAWRHGIVDRQT